MGKGLDALQEMRNKYDFFIPKTDYRLAIIEKELKDKEKQENVLKTISDIIRDFKKGEFANGECALEEISNMLREVEL